MFEELKLFSMFMGISSILTLEDSLNFISLLFSKTFKTTEIFVLVTGVSILLFPLLSFWVCSLSSFGSISNFAANGASNRVKPAYSIVHSRCLFNSFEVLLFRLPFLVLSNFDFLWELPFCFVGRPRLRFSFSVNVAIVVAESDMSDNDLFRLRFEYELEISSFSSSSFSSSSSSSSLPSASSLSSSFSKLAINCSSLSSIIIFISSSFLAILIFSFNSEQFVIELTFLGEVHFDGRPRFLLGLLVNDAIVICWFSWFKS